jgi:hypothetical protein
MPLFGTNYNVLRQTFAVEPRLATMDIAHIDKAFVGRIFRAAVAADDENMV